MNQLKHITIDGVTNIEIKALTLASFISQLSNNFKLHLIAGPWEYPNNGNWYSFAVLATSHITVYYHHKSSNILIDVFTCEDKLDVDKLINHCEKWFKLDRLTYQTQTRGT